MEDLVGLYKTMPKKKPSRPNSQFGSREIMEPKSASQIRRDRLVKTGAIVIVLALLLSLLAGALSVTPAQASNVSDREKSVQILHVDQEIVDTDGDGIENNQDPDVDGDGIVNGEDSDIDGDGIENFNDADPINTTNIDSNGPQKPLKPSGALDNEAQSFTWILIGSIPAAVSAFIIFFRVRHRRKSSKSS